jgi:UDP-glucose 4-epimerase
MTKSEIEKHYQKKKILITGGLGFLGSNLAHALAEKGACVTLVDPLFPEYGGNRFNVAGIEDRVGIIIDDIRSEKLMQSLVKEHELIFHIAGQTSHIDSLKDPFLDLDINCRGTLILLEAVRKFNPKAKIIYAGTRAQYGKILKSPVEEQDYMQPVDIYGVNKHAGEGYLWIYRDVHGLECVSLRINNTYGPRHQMKQANYGILNWFIRLALDSKPITIYGDGSQLRDYNFVDDVTQAFLLAGAIPETGGQAFNLGSGNPIPFYKMAEEIVAIVGKGELQKVPWPEERKKIEVGSYVADYSRFSRTTGWQPEITLKDGIARTVTYYEKYKKHYWS